MKERYQYSEGKEKWYLDIINHRIPDNSKPGTWSVSNSESQEDNSTSPILTEHEAL